MMAVGGPYGENYRISVNHVNFRKKIPHTIQTPKRGFEQCGGEMMDFDGGFNDFEARGKYFIWTKSMQPSDIFISAARYRRYLSVRGVF